MRAAVPCASTTTTALRRCRFRAAGTTFAPRAGAGSWTTTLTRAPRAGRRSTPRRAPRRSRRPRRRQSMWSIPTRIRTRAALFRDPIPIQTLIPDQARSHTRTCPTTNPTTATPARSTTPRAPSQRRYGDSSDFKFKPFARGPQKPASGVSKGTENPRERNRDLRQFQVLKLPNQG